MPLKFILITSILFLGACSSNAPQTKQTQAQPAQAPPDPVRITQFYASPANPVRGQKTLVCYGVENATEVKIEPPIDRVWPSLSRCLELTAAHTVTYTLTAARGTESVSKSLTVSVGAPPPKIIRAKILEVSINKLKVAPGELVSVCYKVEDAKQVTVHPGDWVGPHTNEVGCIADHPQKTTTYTVTASGAGGSVDTEHVTATVQ